MKKKSFALSAFMAMFVITVCIPLSLLPQKKPVLYGKVYLKQRPLELVKIELREVFNKKDAGKTLFKTYSDSKGNYAFYDIPEGEYYIVVLRGNKIYSQLKGGKKIKWQLVKVPKSKSHNIVTVLAHP